MYRRSLHWEASKNGSDDFYPGPVVMRQAEVLVNAGRWKEAEDACFKARRRGQELGLAAVEAEAGFRLGDIFRLKGDYGQALRCLQESADLYGKLSDQGGAARAVGAMGGVYAEQGDYQKAEDCFSRRKAWAEEAGDRTEQCYAWGNLGVIYIEQRMAERALECYRKQRELAEESGDLMGVSIAVGNTGNAYMFQGDYSRALECFQQQRDIALRIGDKRSICALECNLGLLYKRQFRLEEALESFARAIRHSREIGFSRALAISTGNLGSVHQLLGNWQLAEDNIRAFLELSRVHDDKPSMASALGNLSKLNQTLGRVKAAQDLIVQAVSLAREGQLPDLLAILLNMQAELWLEGERWETASGLLEESRKILAERPNREQQEMADMLGLVVEMRRGDKGARDRLEMISQAEPTSQAGLGASRWIYLHTGDSEHGRRAVRQAEELYARSRDAELLVVVEDLHSRINSPGANNGKP